MSGVRVPSRARCGSSGCRRRHRRAGSVSARCSAGSSWRRFSVSVAAGIDTVGWRGVRVRRRGRRRRPTWAWRASPTHHSCAPALRGDCCRRARRRRRVPTCDISSTITVVPAGSGCVRRVARGIGRWSAASRPAARSSAAALMGGCQRDDVRPAASWAAAAACRRGGLAVTRPGDQRSHGRRRHLTAQAAPRRPGRHPAAWVRRRSPRRRRRGRPAAPGVGGQVVEAGEESVLDARGARRWTIRRGRRRSDVGASRTTRSDSRNRSRRVDDLLDGEPAAGDGGDALDHVGFAEPGVASRTSPSRGRPAPRTTRHRCGMVRRSSPRPTTRSSTPAPGSSPTVVASPCQRSRSRSGVSGRVFALAGAPAMPGRRRASGRFLESNANSPRSFQAGLDRGRAFRERPELLAGEADHLPAAVAFRSPLHPQRAGSSVRSRSFRNTVPAALPHTCSGLASNATCSPSARRTTLGIRQWVCSCGSPARLVRCANVAIANPSVATRRRTPPCCWRATAARSSKNSSAVSVASTTAIDTTADVSGVPNAHSSDTDFGTRQRHIDSPHLAFPMPRQQISHRCSGRGR